MLFREWFKKALCAQLLSLMLFFGIPDDDNRLNYCTPAGLENKKQPPVVKAVAGSLRDASLINGSQAAV
jgi:hypothetical protein